MLYKVKREMARLYSLLKDVKMEIQYERESLELFEDIYGQVEHWQDHLAQEEFRVDYLPGTKGSTKAGKQGKKTIKMNVKFFKMVFNRALRVKN